MGAQMPMIFTIGGLAGQMLSPNPCFATLAMSMIALFVRIGSAYALAKPLGYLTISISQPIGWVCALALAFVAYRSGRWTRFSIAARENENQLQEEV